MLARIDRTTKNAVHEFLECRKGLRWFYLEPEC
jgi:hypothetical protein